MSTPRINTVAVWPMPIGSNTARTRIMLSG